MGSGGADSQHGSQRRELQGGIARAHGHHAQPTALWRGAALPVGLHNFPIGVVEDLATGALEVAVPGVAQ